MSRAYSMQIVVETVTKAEKDSILEAIQDNWPIEDEFWYEPTLTLSVSGDSQLCGGETEEEFTQRVTNSIWKAAGRFVPIVVNATCMENLPYESYSFEEGEYENREV
jgi:hypothetical protein